MKNVPQGMCGSKLLIFIVLLSATMVGADGVHAEIYKYVDDNGALHFVDDVTQIPKKHRRKAKVAGNGGYVNTVPVQKRRAADSTKPPIKSAQTVEMYVTSWCPTCKMAENYMKDHGIPYNAYDIERDADARKRFEELAVRNPGLGRIGVPLIIVGEHSMRGFSAQAINSWLGR